MTAFNSPNCFGASSEEINRSKPKDDKKKGVLRIVTSGQIRDEKGALVEDTNHPTWNCRHCGVLANSNRSAVCGNPYCGAPRPR